MNMAPMDGPAFEDPKLVEYGNEADLVAAAIAYAQSVMPDWTPRAGNVEVTLIESLAVMLGPELLSIRLVASEVVEQFIGLFGVRRDRGRPVAGRLQVTVTDSNPMQVIPARSRFRLPIQDTGQTVDFLTESELQIITSETRVGEVRVVADRLGEVGNRTPSGTRLEVVDSLPFIESSVVSGVLAEGAGPETDQSFNTRAASAAARLTSVLGPAESFRFAALSRPGVGRVIIRDNTTPANPTATTFGNITVAVANSEGEPLTTAQSNELREYLSDQALASLVIHVVPPTYTTVNMVVTVRAAPGFGVAQVKANVEEVLRAWLSPATWDWTARIPQYSIAAKVNSAVGVAEVITVPATITLAGLAALPRLGTVSVTVEPAVK